MKSILILLITALSLHSQAKNLICHWQEKTDHPIGFYKAAVFQINFTDKEAVIFNDSFFNRSYPKCYDGGSWSCAFSFTYDKNSPWEITKNTRNKIKMINTWYYTSNLTFYFSKDLNQIKQNESIRLILNGYDDDGTSIDNERFTCQAIME